MDGKAICYDFYAPVVVSGEVREVQVGESCVCGDPGTSLPADSRGCSFQRASSPSQNTCPLGGKLRVDRLKDRGSDGTDSCALTGAREVEGGEEGGVGRGEMGRSNHGPTEWL